MANFTPARTAGLLASLSVISALLTNFAPADPWELLQVGAPPDVILVLPGLYYGVVLCVGVFLVHTRNALGLAVVLLAVIIAWICAWKAGYELYQYLERHYSGPIGFGGASMRAPFLLAIAGVVAGMVGSAITVTAVATVCRTFRSTTSCARTILVGSVTGVLLGLQAGIDSMLPLFLVWQPMVAAMIGHGLARPKSAPPPAVAAAA
jgi:hypothetical protein